MNRKQATALVRRLSGCFGDLPFTQERIDECMSFFVRLPEPLGTAIVDRLRVEWEGIPRNLIYALDKLRAKCDVHATTRDLVDRTRRDCLQALAFRKTHSADGADWTLRRMVAAHREAMAEQVSTYEAANLDPSLWTAKVRACDTLLAEIDDPYGGQHHYPVSSEEARDAEEQPHLPVRSLQ